MSFNESGFLGVQAFEIESDVYQNNKKLFKFAFEVNSFMNQNMYKLDVDSNNIQELTVACLFIRIMNSYQSTLLLARKGLVSDAKAMLRILIETLLLQKACAEDKQFAVEYIKSSEARRLKLMNIIKNDENKVFKDFIEPNSAEEMARLKEYVELEKIPDEYKAFELAKKTNLTSIYDYAYRSLSNEVHISPNTLEKYIVINNYGEIEGLSCIPLLDDVPLIIKTLIVIGLITLDNISKLFNLCIDEELTEYEKRFDIMIHENA